MIYSSNFVFLSNIASYDLKDSGIENLEFTENLEKIKQAELSMIKDAQITKVGKRAFGSKDFKVYYQP